MEEALLAYLQADAPLTVLLTGKIFWTQKPQNVSNPVLLLTRISGTRDMQMLGPSGLVESRVQFDCDGLTYGSAKGVARALRDRLSGFKGLQGTMTFHGCFLEAERDTFDEAITIDKLYRTSLDFMIWHKEN
ncbi:MAG: DUF3168 domain-containing protein [Aestuariivirga sp.]